MAKFKPADIDQIKSLVSAAVGADPTRGDNVAVVVRNFDTVAPPKVNFWEQPWFATVLHNGVALLGLVLVLLLGVRPLVKALKRPPPLPAPLEAAAGEADAAEELAPIDAIKDPVTGAIDAEALGRQVGIAQRLVAEKPDSAALALRQMLQPPVGSEG
jgi:flagellar M-ring protein FliF